MHMLSRADVVQNLSFTFSSSLFTARHVEDITHLRSEPTCQYRLFYVPGVGRPRMESSSVKTEDMGLSLAHDLKVRCQRSQKSVPRNSSVRVELFLLRCLIHPAVLVVP